MVEVTDKPISPEPVIGRVKTDSSGCVVAYIGLIRAYSRAKAVLSVEYEDVGGTAQARLQQIADEAKQKWPLENLAIVHRVGKLKVGDINLVVAVASAHREDGFAACQYVIDQFKQNLPTQKRETYEDGSIWVEDKNTG